MTKHAQLCGVRGRTAAGLVAAFAWMVCPSSLLATHEADHRFTVEGFVCGVDGTGRSNVDVLIKDTRISYGQTVKTDGEGYYTATFHLHNENLGDPLYIEVAGEGKESKVQFDPKDLESERKVQVHFGSGCIHDPSAPPLWAWSVVGAAVAGAAGFAGAKVFRSWRKQAVKREKGHGRKKRSI